MSTSNSMEDTESIIKVKRSMSIFTDSLDEYNEEIEAIMRFGYTREEAQEILENSDDDGYFGPEMY